MSETGSENNGNENSETLGDVTDKFFKKRDVALSAVIKTITPAVLGVTGAGVALFSGSLELAGLSLSLGGAGTIGMYAYEMMKGTVDGYKEADEVRKANQSKNSSGKSS